MLGGLHVDISVTFQCLNYWRYPRGVYRVSRWALEYFCRSITYFLLIALIFSLESITFVGISSPAVIMRYVSFYSGSNMMQWALHSTPYACYLSLVGHTKCGNWKYPVHPTFQLLRSILSLYGGRDTTNILSKLPSSRASSVLTRLCVRLLMNQ